MRFQTLLYFYGRRLRTHPVQELLAGVGIAIGVTLAFAVMVANSSVVASAEEIVRGVTGTADFQLTSRDGRGFGEAEVIGKVRDTPGVVTAAPALERRAVLVGPKGDEVAVNLVSIDQSLAGLSGRLMRTFAPGGLEISTKGLVVPTATADALGIKSPALEATAKPLPTVRMDLRGRVIKPTVSAVLGEDIIGPLSGAKIGILPLPFLQAFTETDGRVSRILVDAKAGEEQAVRQQLERIAAGRLSVTAADVDVDLLEQATGPTNQVTGFFAAISALLGLLLAFNAMLLTAPERRRLISSLRTQGYRPNQVILLVLFQAVALGAIASLIGVLIGGALSRGLFQDSPDYLAPGFTLGSRTIIGTWPLVLAFLGGLAASCLAAAPPLLDLRRDRAVDAVFHERGVPGNALSSRARQRMLLGAIALFAVATILLVWAPEAAIAASVMLAGGTLLAIPTTFALAVRLMEALIARVPRLSTLTVSLLAMRATTLRSLALAATGAVAVFGSVAIGGARDDLLRGIGNYAEDFVGTADLWVVNPADNQATNDFIGSDRVEQQVAAAPGVAKVRRYYGGFLDFDGRRTWLIARPPDDPAMLPQSSILEGNLTTATGQLRRGGWVGVSEQIARQRDLELGDSIALPTPTGTHHYRIAATTTNLGWAPGAIILNASDYRRAWGNPAPTAIEVDLAAGADVAATANAIEQALGADSGLRVQTADARARQINASAEQGLERLGQISLLLLIAAVLAMAAAMGAAIWQRRAALAALRVQSFSPRQLWLLILLEASIVLGAGGLTGALGGIYGQLGADRFLEVVTGFPVAPVPAGWHTIETFGLVVLAALAIIAIPGWFASRVPARFGLGSE